MSTQPVVYAIATMDTKGPELEFVADRIRAAGMDVVTVDVSTTRTTRCAPDIAPPEVLAATGTSFDTLCEQDRGTAVTQMGEALAVWLRLEADSNRVAGVIGLGGSGGTALITRAMRALPIGLPKLMVSTVASGQVGSYVDCSDICMMYSVVDVAGLNAVSIPILANAAAAIAGMAGRPASTRPPRPAIGMTMFGVTTPCVTAVRQSLDAAGFDCLVFHATGSGGRAMEKLVASGLITGVLDITTTEVADEVVGGVFPAGPARFDAILEAQVPYVISLGAMDMVNFGPRETVPEQFRGRLFHIHNAQVTLMRTTADELRACARWITGKLSQAVAPVTILIPEGGVSALDAPGQPFHDPVADRCLFDEIESGLAASAHCRVLRSPCHLNDPEFAGRLVEEFLRLVSAKAGSSPNDN